ncbi:hypothetical protein [Gilvibacter sediminis]|uniref:hypothetical protein n=1 Tax=Gilvibacter sediminis TaxID=379071 RepID=UPI002350D283|nr:hypothetical protein [Gilvibacter sediminis]MDC7998280.1 hypothetical protein [Gilvibacter sediminis]
MEGFSEILASDMWSAYLEISILMLSSFLIGYLASLQLNNGKHKKAIKKLRKELDERQNEAAKDIEVLYTEIEPKIIETIESRTRATTQAAPVKAAPVVVNTPTPETAETKQVKTQQEVAAKASAVYQKALEKKELNFDNFGYASASDKDDLTQISGVGPYIEQKLNEIGIYTYDQISRFNWEDIQTVTEMIDFFPGRMERDNWVGQAERLKNY